MSFVYPGWFLLAAILPVVLIGAILDHRGRSNAWKKLVAPRLQKKLVQKGSHTRRWISLGLALLGCLCLFATIARPYYGETKTTDQVTSRNIIIAIDTSRSMLVRDGSPNRITAAKAIAIELIEAFPNDRVGIIAFSGRPVLMVPLTVDHGAVLEVIGQLDTEMIPSGGSNLAAAAELAIQTFEKTGQESNALIILSDGEDHSAETDLAANHIREAGIRVCAIGIGTSEGGLIPDRRRRDGKFRDYRGNTVTSKMIPDALQQISQIGKGTYLPASKGADRLIRSALASLESETQDGDEASIPNERYYWFLIPAVILILLSILVRSHFSMRNKLHTTSRTASQLSTVGLFLSSFFLLTPSTEASADIKQAQTYYEEQQYEKAIEGFTESLPDFKGEDRYGIEFALGSSLYHLEQWERSISFFSNSLLTEKKDLQVESHYNLGNALFKSGWSTLNPETAHSDGSNESSQNLQMSNTVTDSEQAASEQPDKGHVITLWEDAIEHYDAALQISSDHKKAQHNKQEVQKALEQLQEQKKQEEEQQEKEEQDNQEDSEESDEGEEGEEDQEGEEDGDGENQEEGENGEEEQEEEGSEGDQESEQEGEQQQQEGQESEQEEGESDEEFAARILEDESDLETRPIIKRLRNPQRTAKDW